MHLLRPGAGTAVSAGARINGIGWVVHDGPIAGIDVWLGNVRLGRARVGLSPSDLTMLIGQTPSEATTGFVFAVTVPRFASSGPVTLRLRVAAANRHHDHDVTLDFIFSDPSPAIAAPPPEKNTPEPVRAMIDSARIDERGLLTVVGWAASLSPLETLDIVLGGRALGSAQRGLRRDDVAAMLPEYEGAGTAGFMFRQEVGDEDLAHGEVRLRVTARGNIRREFSGILARPERLRRRAAEILATLACEELSLDAEGGFAVKGWAVASSGVAEIVVELDDEVVGTVLPSEDRPDVGNRYPRIAGAALSGFRFRRQLDSTFEGDHVVRLTVRGRGGERNSCFSAVAVTPAPPRQDAPQTGDQSRAASAPSDGEAIKFFLDSPACKDGFAIETVRGFLALNGWAFGRDGIEAIEVFVDGISQGRAHHGIRREDLQNAFPEYDALRAGFAMVLPPQVMKPGEHALRIDIRDKAGRGKELSFSVRAEQASSGPGPWMPRAKIPQAEIDVQHAILAARGHAPRWGFFMALDDGGDAALAALSVTVESLRWQAYENFFIIMVAEDSWAARIQAHLDAAGDDFLRGRLTILPPRPERTLAELVGERIIVPLTAGDRLGEDALLELSVAGALEKRGDFFYSDERRIDPSDGQDKAFFKPDFSPDLLLSTNYIGRLWAAAPALLRDAELTEGDWRAQGEYDAILRLTERAGKILHVPNVLCASARRAEARGAEQRALSRALRRRKISATLLPGPVPGTWRPRRELTKDSRAAMVSIIIPTNFSRDLIRTALGTIRAQTAWPSYEILVLDTISAGDDPAAAAEKKKFLAENADRVIDVGDKKFNWSRLNNRGARAARGSFLLFLNDDVEVRDPDWLAGLIEHAQRPEVGVVGPQLLYPDGRVQHAGVFLARRAARHAFRFYPSDEPGPFGLARTQRDVISVTGACMMIRRDVFDALGGFDEAHAVVNNDLDFSLRARRAGFSVVYTPAVSLIHHEMVSRAALADTYNSKRFEESWGDLFRTGDPFFSRHFSPDYDDFLPDSEPVRIFAAGHPLFSREKTRKILAVKVDHIGDFITAFPAFRRIKERFPDAELTVLAAKASLSLAEMEPAIDRVEEFNFFHARSEKGRRSGADKELAALRARLAPQRFDLAIDLRRQPDTREILQATGARWLAGFESGYRHPWLDITVEFEGDLAGKWKTQHVTDSLLGLVDAVSARGETDRRLVRAPPAQAEARVALLELLGVERAGPVVCVHAGAGALNKQWPADSFAGLIDLLVGVAGATVVVIGGPDEAAFSAGVILRARHRGAVHNLVGKTSLRALPGVLAAADLYVGNDSGPKHIAAALGVPTIGIHSGSVDAGEWGAVGPRALTIRRAMTCSPCYLALASDCHRGLACLDGIRVGDVFAACQRLLALAAPVDVAR